jgi:outer membrane lipoprotein SlyB
MESTTTQRRIHPLAAGAAISVMLVSLTGVAAITGLIPSSHGTAEAEQQVSIKPQEAEANPASAPAAQAAATTQAKPSPAIQQRPKSTAQTSQYRTAQSTPAKPAPCHSCGRVDSVQVIQQAGQPSGVGMVAGAVLGGVLGNQVGGGNGRKLATVAGAVGGGYAGNEVEKRTRATTTYQVRVRMENGEMHSFPYSEQPSWSAGDRVRVVDGRLTTRG